MKKIANAYDLLMKKNYEIKIDNTIYILEFKATHLKHLLGLDKLNSNDFIKNMSSNKVLSNINSGKLTYDYLQGIDDFWKIQSRIENFYYFSNFLLTNTYLIMSQYINIKPETRNNFNFLLYHQCVKEKSENVCLGLRIENDDKLIPVTYFNENKFNINNNNQVKDMKIINR